MWDVRRLRDVSMESLAVMDLMTPPPEVLVVGCGARMRRLPQALMQQLADRRVAVEVLDTVGPAVGVQYVACLNVFARVWRSWVCGFRCARRWTDGAAGAPCGARTVIVQLQPGSRSTLLSSTCAGTHAHAHMRCQCLQVCVSLQQDTFSQSQHALHSIHVLLVADKLSHWLHPVP